MREYKLIAVSAACTFLFFSGVLTNNLQLYWMATTLLLMMIGSYWLAYQGGRSVHIERQVRHEAWEGERLEVHLRVENRAPFPKPGLLLRDRLPAWLAQGGQNGQATLCLLPLALGAFQTSETFYTLTPSQRGLYPIGPLELISTDPLGFHWVVTPFSQIDEILVYPRPLPIPGWNWRHHWWALGLREAEKSLRTGSGTNWQGTREYVPGDPLRRIHWRATARTSRWHVHEYETGQLTELLILLDLFETDPPGSPSPAPLPGSLSPFELSVRYATWLSLEGWKRGLPVRLAGSGWEGIAVQGGEIGSRYRLLKALATVQAHGKEPLSTFLHRQLATLSSQATLCLLCPNVDPDLPQVVKSCFQKGLKILVVPVGNSSQDAEWLHALLLAGAQVIRTKGGIT